MRAFDACVLCQTVARTPMICDEGHVYCKECVLADLVSQKASIQRQTQTLQKLAAEHANSLALAKQAARQRVIEEFERSQSLTSFTTSSTVKTNNSENKKTIVGASLEEESRKRKRDKMELDEEEVEKRMQEWEREAGKEIEREEQLRKKAKLPNFWLPSLTPEAAPTKLTQGSLKTLCRATEPPHPMSLKGLMSLSFKEEERAGEKKKICACCERIFNNGIKIYALKCTHVLCATCVDSLCKEGRCAVCDKVFDESRQPLNGKNGDTGEQEQKDGKKKKEKKGKGMILLAREGTGFASGGRAEAKSAGVAFQA